MRAYGRVLMKTPVRISVCITYIALLAAGIYGFSKLTLGFDLKLLGKDGSNFVKWVEIMESEFPSASWSVSIVLDQKNIDYTTSSVQESIIGLNKLLENSRYYDGDSTLNWLTHFRSTTNRSMMEGSNFYPALRSFLGKYPQYLPDIIFTNGSEMFLQNSTGTIKASRIIAQTAANPDWIFRRKSMDNLRKDLKRHEEKTSLRFTPACYW